MKEEFINFWNSDISVKCITTNGDVNRFGKAVMGRGIAYQANKRINGIDIILGHLIKEVGNVPQYLCANNGFRYLSFPVKHHWHEKADLNLIEESAHKLVILADSYNYKLMALPRPGCGNGGLDWDEVKSVIEPILDDRFVIIERPFRAN